MLANHAVSRAALARQLTALPFLDEFDGAALLERLRGSEAAVPAATTRPQLAAAFLALGYDVAAAAATPATETTVESEDGAAAGAADADDPAERQAAEAAPSSAEQSAENETAESALSNQEGTVAAAAGAAASPPLGSATVPISSNADQTFDLLLASCELLQPAALEQPGRVLDTAALVSTLELVRLGFGASALRLALAAADAAGTGALAEHALWQALLRCAREPPDELVCTHLRRAVSGRRQRRQQTAVDDAAATFASPAPLPHAFSLLPCSPALVRAPMLCSGATRASGRRRRLRRAVMALTRRRRAQAAAVRAALRQPTLRRRQC